MGINSNRFYACSFRQTNVSTLLASPGPCNLEVRDGKSLSQQEFMSRYNLRIKCNFESILLLIIYRFVCTWDYFSLSRYAYQAPVVITGATDNSVSNKTM